jgi:pimeloyl-ACP methyl ester carboxylesterase
LSIYPVTVDGVGTVELSVNERGTGHPVLLLHGGAGPLSVAGFTQLLADRHPVHVFAPSHPGFGGSPRPDGLSTIAGLVDVYAEFLDELDLHEVTVIGNSMGGWIAAELALQGRARIGSLVLVDATGIEVEGHPVADIFALSPVELAKRSFHNPLASPLNPATMTDQQKAGMAANRVALALYGGQPPKTDPTLLGRLARLDVPTLVLWGESDRIVDPDYGRAFAAAIPNSRFELLRETGHVPQIETPDRLLAALWEFVAPFAARRPGPDAGG